MLNCQYSLLLKHLCLKCLCSSLHLSPFVGTQVKVKVTCLRWRWPEKQIIIFLFLKIWQSRIQQIYLLGIYFERTLYVKLWDLNFKILGFMVLIVWTKAHCSYSVNKCPFSGCCELSLRHCILIFLLCQGCFLLHKGKKSSAVFCSLTVRGHVEAAWAVMPQLGVLSTPYLTTTCIWM